MRQIERQDIFKHLQEGHLVKKITREFGEQYMLTVSDAEHYLHQLDIPFSTVRTADNYSRYIDHFIFVFTPLKAIETAIVIRDAEKALDKTEYLGNNKLRQDLRRVLSVANGDKLNFHMGINHSTAVNVVFVFENLRGSVVEDKNYRFTGVFTAIPKDLLGGE